jgi:hypothetical protein
MTTLREVESSPDELQERNNQKHTRVFDPELYALVKELLAEIKDMNEKIKIITGD